jgi:hypothetical protein
MRAVESPAHDGMGRFEDKVAIINVRRMVGTKRGVVKSAFDGTAELPPARVFDR